MHIIYTHTKQLDCAWTFIRLPRRIATHMSQLYENTHIHKYIVYALVAAYFADERDPQTQTTWLVANLCAARLEHGHYPKQLGLPTVAAMRTHIHKYLFIFKYARIVCVRPHSLISQSFTCTTT